MKRDISSFVIVSFLFHLLLLWLLQVGAKYQKERAPSEVELVLNDPALPHQIADIAEPKFQEKPKKADFLGMYDSRVEQPTVAATVPITARERPEKQADPSSGGKKKSAGEEGSGPQLASIPVEPSPHDKEAAAKNNKAKPEKKSAGTIDTGPSEVSAYPEDFYPDYKVGAHTYLNVLRFPKIGYFVRLKKIFKTTFDPVPALRQQANQITRGQVEVVLGVTVGASGSLDELVLINSSGLQLYDAEALRTIHDSAPFAAPPKELLDANGKLRMSWTFTVYL